MKHFLILFYSLINSQTTSNNNPVRLEKKEKQTSFDDFCRKICPYVIFFGLLVLIILILFALVKYGFIFSTEAHQYEHLQQITIGG